MGEEQRRKDIKQDFRARFGEDPVLWAQAPGRVDLMGSHTDYNLGFVLTLAIDRNVWLAVQPREDQKIQICSRQVEGCGVFSLDYISYHQELPWTNYIGGVAAMFMNAGYPVSGFNGLIDSTIPIGSGLSSSAALEVSTAVVLNHLDNLEIDPVEMALLCQQAENEFVGLNVGILDQYTSLMGEAGKVLLLDCRDNSSINKSLAEGIQIVICDTRAERELTGSEYAERRHQCEEGVEILRQEDPTIRSLRDATIDLLRIMQAEMPPTVFQRCKFIVEENRRVLKISEAIKAGNRNRIAKLTSDSFHGARDLYEIISPEMEYMMQAMIQAPGVIGARQAGAGFGGCMVAVVESESAEAFQKSAAQHYKKLSGIQPEIYPVQASPGAGILEGRDADD